MASLMIDTAQFRCSSCSKLLLVADDGAVAGRLTIKCPRCRAINTLGPDPATQPERQSQVTPRASKKARPDDDT